MNRRSATWVLRILLLTAVITVSNPASVVASVPDDTVPDATVQDATVPTDTANPFLPEERDLTDCIGLLQRPGCGSEARGGLGQTLVAIFMVGGLVLIFGRVAWGIRRNRHALPPAGPDAPHRSTGDRPGDGAVVGTSDAADDATRRPTDAESGNGAS